jgi:hypothetical protein
VTIVVRENGMDKNVFKSIGAIPGGVVAAAVVSIGIDLILE